jgi:hypothetical protein
MLCHDFFLHCLKTHTHAIIIYLVNTNKTNIKNKTEAVFSGPEYLVPVLLTAGFLEITWKQKQGSFPGDFSATGFPVGFGPYARDEADMIDLRTRELNNGRAAQMGILGMMVHEQLDGKPFIFFDKFDIYAPSIN